MLRFSGDLSDDTYISLNEQGNSGEEEKEREQWSKALWALDGVQLGHLHTKITFPLTLR